MSDLNDSQSGQLEELLRSYEDIFSSGTHDFSRTNKITHKINTGDTIPIRQPPRRLPGNRREEVGSMIQTMIGQDVIQPSCSPWTARIVLVKKKEDGSTRFCVDYRRLNDVTKKDAYSLPRTDDTLDALAGAKMFSTLHLASGYWQVELDYGIGGVLSQIEGNEERVIGYASRSLTKPERRYSTTRKELLDIVAFIQHFRHYLYGKSFIIRTDHNSLKWLKSLKEPQGQVARWIEREIQARHRTE